MSVVLITKSKLDTMAQTVAAKTDTTVPMTIDEMNTAIESLQAATVTLQAKTGITPTTSSQTITADSGYHGLSSVEVEGDSNLIASNIKEDVSIFGVTGTYNSAPNIDTVTATATSNSTSLSFTGLQGEPIMWAMQATNTISLTSGYYYIDSVRYDGNGCSGQNCYYKSGGGGSRAVYYNDTAYSYTYNNGTLTVSSSASYSTAGGAFYGTTYELVYVY